MIKECELLKVYRQDPEAARALVRDALHKSGGSPIKACKYLELSSRVHIWHWLRRLDMEIEPEVIRQSRRSFYRLTEARNRMPKRVK